MGLPLGVVLVFMVDTELWHVHLPVHGEKGKKTKSRANRLHTREVSITASTLPLFYWELHLNVATPTFRKGAGGVLG